MLSASRPTLLTRVGAALALLVAPLAVLSTAAPAQAGTPPPPSTWPGYTGFASFCSSTPSAFISLATDKTYPTELRRIATLKTGGSKLEPLGTAGTRADGMNYNSTAMSDGKVLYAVSAFKVTNNNAIAYNTTTNKPKLLIVDSNGQVTTLGDIEGPTTGTEGTAWTNTVNSSLNAGNINGSDYYIYAGAIGAVFKIDLTDTTPPFTATYVGTSPITSPVKLPNDFAYADGHFWGIVDTTIYRIDVEPGRPFSVTTFDGSAILKNMDGSTTTGPFGSAWSMGNGNLGVANNTSGTVFQIDINNADSATPSFKLINKFQGQGSGTNDGAVCKGVNSNLTMTKTADPITATGGDTIKYTITVSNSGPDASSGYVMTDQMPAGLSDVTVDSQDAFCLENAGKYSCTGTILPAGAKHTIIITGTLPATFTKVTNVAQLTNNDKPDPPSGPVDVPATVYPKATMADDTATTNGGVAVTLDPLSNDKTGTVKAGDPAITWDKSKLCLPEPTTADPNACVTTRTTTEGTWTVDTTTGIITFTPADGFVGDATVTYRATDSNGMVFEATMTVTVLDPKPAPAPNTVTTAYKTPAVIDVLANDGEGPSESKLDATSVKLQDANGNWVTTLTTSDGKYVVDPVTGEVTFTPAVGFVGTAAPVTYQVTNALGQSATSTITATVTKPGAATVTNDTATTPQGVPATVDPLANDTGTPKAPLQPSTVKLIDPATGQPDPDNSVTIEGKGTFTLDPDTGKVTFTPLPGFVGDATIGYQVKDEAGTPYAGTVTVTTTAVTPDAVADTPTVPYLTKTVINVLGNDSPGNSAVALDPSSLTLMDGATPVSTLTIPGEGTYRVNATTHKIEFTPVAGFTGTATPVTYRIADVNGTTDTATITPTVPKPAAPTTVNDAPAAGLQGATQTIYPLANDKTGDPAVALDPSTLTLLDPATNTYGKTLTVPGEGTYTVNPDGSLTFVPLPGFSGTATPITYRVADDLGQTATGSITTTVTAVTPNAVNDIPAVLYASTTTINVLANDTAGAPSVPLKPGTLTLMDGDTPVTTLTIPGQGTYTVNQTTNTIEFTSARGFAGETTPVTYRISDANGTTDTATITTTVAKPDNPAIGNDVATTPQGVPATVYPLTTDTPAPNSSLQASSLALVDPATGQPAAGNTVTVPGQGTFTVDPATGAVNFTPLPGFVGDASITYAVKDEVGTTFTGTITITTAAVAPNAVNDTATALYAAKTVVDVLANDKPGDPSVPLDPATLTLMDGDTPVSTLTVPGQGTFVVNPTTHQIEFTPVRGFTGDVTPLTYRVADKNGTTDTATLSLTVAKPGDAAIADDSVSTPQGVPATVKPLVNDAAASNSSLQADTLKLLDPATGQPAAGNSVTIPGQGTFTLDPATGEVTFTPVPGFIGTATIGYQVKDEAGTPFAGTISVTTTAVTPAAENDAPTALYGVPSSLDVLANDKPGDPGVPLVPSSLTLMDGATPVSTLTIPGQGTYTVNPTTHQIDFTPAPGFTGTASSVIYRVTDKNGTTDTARLTVTVADPGAPAIAPDSTTTPQGVPVTVSPLANDTAAANSGLLPDTLRLIDPATGQPDADNSVTVPGKGTFTLDPATGKVTFTPEPGFTGNATITYQVKDEAQDPYTGTISVTATVVTPVPVDDRPTAPYATKSVIDVLANDKPGDPGVPLVPSSLTLMDGNTPVTTLTIPGQGTYVVNPTTHTIEFTPVPGFTGEVDPVIYRVTDKNGTTATATITTTVTKPADAAIANDTVKTPQGVPVLIDPLANDAAAPKSPLQPGSVTLIDPGSGQPASGNSVTIPGQGTFTVDTTTGQVTFTPAPGFTGDTTVTYQVKDQAGTPFTGTITVTASAVQPVAVNDAPTVPYGATTSLDVLANDKPGNAGVPLVPSSLTLLDGQTPVTKLVIPGEGTYVVNPTTHTIEFTPVPGFTGAATPVTYQVADKNGTTDTGTVSVTVAKPGDAVLKPDLASTPQGLPVSISPLANDVAAAGSPLQAGTLRLLDPATGQPAAGNSLTIPGKGTFTLDPATGKVTFTPLPGFTGTASVDYQVKDEAGTPFTGTITVTATPLTPRLADDSVRTPYQSTVSFNPLANDQAGNPGVPLVAGSVRLIDPKTGALVTTLTIPGQGTYVVNADGTITFTPVAGYSGTSTVKYSVADANGTRATAAASVIVGAAPPAPPAQAQANTPQGQAVVIDVLKQVKSTQPLDPATLCLVDGTACVPTLTVTGEGTWQVNPNGTVTFTPKSDFAGAATPVTFQVKDVTGVGYAGQVQVVVAAAAAGVADTQSVPCRPSLRTKVLKNDIAGDGATFKKRTLRLLVPGKGAKTHRVSALTKPTKAVRSLDLPGVGTVTVKGRALVLQAAPSWSGSAKVRYQVRTSTGKLLTSTVTWTRAARCASGVAPSGKALPSTGA